MRRVSLGRAPRSASGSELLTVLRAERGRGAVGRRRVALGSEALLRAGLRTRRLTEPTSRLLGRRLTGRLRAHRLRARRRAEGLRGGLAEPTRLLLVRRLTDRRRLTERRDRRRPEGLRRL